MDTIRTKEREEEEKKDSNKKISNKKVGRFGSSHDEILRSACFPVIRYVLYMNGNIEYYLPEIVKGIDDILNSWVKNVPPGKLLTTESTKFEHERAWVRPDLHKKTLNVIMNKCKFFTDTSHNISLTKGGCKEIYISYKSDAVGRDAKLALDRAGISYKLHKK